MKKLVLALALAAGLTSFAGNAKSQIYNFTTLNNPNGSDGTDITGISGSTVVGYYSAGPANGFTETENVFTTVNNP